MKNQFSNTINVHIKAPTTKVWDALTKPEIIKQYFFGTNAKSDWKPGSAVTFKGEYEGKTYEDKGTVLENQPGRKLKYDYWSSMSGIEDKPENYAPITYELEENNNGTDLTVIQENIPDEKMK